MTRDRADLEAAKRRRADEFLTLPETVDTELPAYRASLRGAHVVCPCNDGPDGAFLSWFAAHYGEFGLSGLTGFLFEPSYGTLFEHGCGRRFDWNGRGFTTTMLRSDGGFDSPDVRGYYVQSNVVVISNPPFSRIRRLLGCLDHAGTRFLLLAPLTAVMAPVAVPHMLDGSWRFSPSIRAGVIPFRVGGEYPLFGADIRPGRVIGVPGVRWLTNLPVPLPPVLDLSANRFDATRFPCYDQLDAIEVKHVRDVPADWPGLMGVPITMFDRLANTRPRLKAVGVRRDLTIGGRGVFYRVLVRIVPSHEHS